MLVTVFLLRDKKPADSGEPFNLQSVSLYSVFLMTST